MVLQSGTFQFHNTTIKWKVGWETSSIMQVLLHATRVRHCGCKVLSMQGTRRRQLQQLDSLLQSTVQWHVSCHSQGCVCLQSPLQVYIKTECITTKDHWINGIIICYKNKLQSNNFFLVLQKKIRSYLSLYHDHSNQTFSERLPVIKIL